MISNADTKICPQCAEEVRTEAIRCKHCGADLVDDAMKELVRRYASLANPQRVEMVKAMSSEQMRDFKRVWQAVGATADAKPDQGTASNSPPRVSSVRGGEAIGAMTVIAGLLIGLIGVFSETGCGFGLLVMLVGLAVFVWGRFQR